MGIHGKDSGVLRCGRLRWWQHLSPSRLSAVRDNSTASPFQMTSPPSDCLDDTLTMNPIPRSAILSAPTGLKGAEYQGARVLRAISAN